MLIDTWIDLSGLGMELLLARTRQGRTFYIVKDTGTLGTEDGTVEHGPTLMELGFEPSPAVPDLYLRPAVFDAAGRPEDPPNPADFLSLLRGSTSIEFDEAVHVVDAAQLARRLAPASGTPAPEPARAQPAPQAPPPQPPAPAPAPVAAKPVPPERDEPPGKPVLPLFAMFKGPQPVSVVLTEEEAQEFAWLRERLGDMTAVDPMMSGLAKIATALNQARASADAATRILGEGPEKSKERRATTIARGRAAGAAPIPPAKAAKAGSARRSVPA